MFARMSRYNPVAPGIRSPPRIPAAVQNGRSWQVPASPGTRSGRIIELTSGLLIRGFGVGERHALANETRFGEFIDDAVTRLGHLIDATAGSCDDRHGYLTERA